MFAVVVKRMKRRRDRWTNGTDAGSELTDGQAIDGMGCCMMHPLTVSARHSLWLAETQILSEDVSDVSPLS